MGRPMELPLDGIWIAGVVRTHSGPIRLDPAGLHRSLITAPVWPRPRRTRDAPGWQQPQEIGSATSTVLHYSSPMNRITIDPEQCGGRPCIRGMRIRVTDVLDLLSNGLTSQQVLEELPDLELEDIQACLQYASRKLNHPVLVAA